MSAREDRVKFIKYCRPTLGDQNWMPRFPNKLSTRFDDPTTKVLKDIAQKNNQSISEVIRKFVIKALAAEMKLDRQTL